MRPPCIFCDHDSGSPEHLWPDWMHNTVKFAPINMQEADGPIITGQDPEQTITTVCHDCNTGWMCLIENKASTRLKPMLLNEPIEIDRGGMKLLTQWAVLRAMVFESIKPKSGNEQFFTREERIAFKANQTVPERTRVWVGACSRIPTSAITAPTTLSGGPPLIAHGSEPEVSARFMPATSSCRPSPSTFIRPLW